MRASTAFKRLLRLPGASIIEVAFAPEGVVVTVGLRRRRRVCAICGQTGRQLEIHDRRVKRWRHLDLGRTRRIVECELRRLCCPDCGVRPEPVPWARPGSAYTPDFEDVVAWLAQRGQPEAFALLIRARERPHGHAGRGHPRAEGRARRGGPRDTSRRAAFNEDRPVALATRATDLSCGTASPQPCASR